eukprot:1158700-Pelagomonas_calceolata.AAC.15
MGNCVHKGQRQEQLPHLCLHLWVCARTAVTRGRAEAQCKNTGVAHTFDSHNNAAIRLAGMPVNGQKNP